MSIIIAYNRFGNKEFFKDEPIKLTKNCDINESIYKNKKLIKIWNFHRNNISPKSIGVKSKTKVWWKCDKGHEWKFSPYRQNNDKCPVCNNVIIIPNINSFGIINNHLLKEWNYSKNIIDPYTVFPFARTKVWWNTRKRKWYAHTTIKISLEEQENNFNAKVKHSPVKVFDRTCGIDQNSNFITATIIDKHANPVNKLTLEHSNSKDISALVSKLVVWAVNNGVYRFSIEKLKSLNYKKRKSNGSGAGLNRIVSRIPFGEFKKCLNTITSSYGLEVVEVNPYNTSKNSKYWCEDRFGVTVHEKASYLIARKSLGLSILRRDHFNDYPEENRVSWRAISVNDGSILRNSHDNSLVNGERVVGCGS